MGLAIDRALATGDAGRLLLWLGVLVALYIMLTAAAKLTNRLTAYMVQLLQHRLRSTLSIAALHPVGGAARTPDGTVVSVMTNDVAGLANGGILLIMPAVRIAANLTVCSALAPVRPRGPCAYTTSPARSPRWSLPAPRWA